MWTLLKLARASLIALLLSWLGLYLLQDKLLFFPQHLSAMQRKALAQDPQIEALTLKAADGTMLQGWLRHPARTGPAPVLVYFGGNADEASSIFDYADDWPGWAVAAVNYRGYGDSGGQPAEAALRSDAQLLYDTLARRPDVDAKNIVALGRSLGSGLAVALAHNRPLAGVILVTPYDSLPAVAGDHFPWVPTGLLMRNRFDSLSVAPQLHTPALFVVAGQDQVITNPHSAHLYDAWAGPKDWLRVPDASHADILTFSPYRQRLQRFLTQYGGPQAAISGH